DRVLAEVVVGARLEAVAGEVAGVGIGVVDVYRRGRPALAELAHDAAVGRPGNAEQRHQQGRPEGDPKAGQERAATPAAEAAKGQQAGVRPAHGSNLPRLRRSCRSARWASSGLWVTTISVQPRSARSRSRSSSEIGRA